MKINDPFALGSLSGIIASIPQLFLNLILKQIGFANYYLPQLSGGVFLLKKFTSQPLGLIFGAIIWLATASALGVLIVYLLRLTGKEYWWIKGLFVSIIIMFIGIYGIIFNIGGAVIVPYDITTNYHILIEDIIFGLLTSYLAMRWS